MGPIKPGLFQASDQWQKGGARIFDVRWVFANDFEAAQFLTSKYEEFSDGFVEEREKKIVNLFEQNVEMTGFLFCKTLSTSVRCVFQSLVLVLKHNQERIAQRLEPSPRVMWLRKLWLSICFESKMLSASLFLLERQFEERAKILKQVSFCCCREFVEGNHLQVISFNKTRVAAYNYASIVQKLIERHSVVRPGGSGSRLTNWLKLFRTRKD